MSISRSALNVSIEITFEEEGKNMVMTDYAAVVLRFVLSVTILCSWALEDSVLTNYTDSFCSCTNHMPGRRHMPNSEVCFSKQRFGNGFQKIIPPPYTFRGTSSALVHPPRGWSKSTGLLKPRLRIISRVSWGEEENTNPGTTSYKTDMHTVVFALTCMSRACPL